jgi:hypothetical protein
MAVKGAIASKYRNVGQTCVCANRILARDRLRRVHQAPCRDCRSDEGRRRFEPGAVIGPLIDMKAVEKVKAHFADAVKKGGPKSSAAASAARGGTFFERTVLTDVTTDMVVTKEETFGPVVPLYCLRPAPRPSRWPMTPNSVSPRHRPHLARCRRARIRHRRHQRRYHLDRDRPLWRHEGKRHQPRGLEMRASRNSSKSNTSAWAVSTVRRALNCAQVMRGRTIPHH